jgi:hypothetical protein
MPEKEKTEKKPPTEMEWNPEMPLADEEDEAEVQRRAKAEARKSFLIGTYSKEPGESGGKKKKRSLWG